MATKSRECGAALGRAAKGVDDGDRELSGKLGVKALAYSPSAFDISLPEKQTVSDMPRACPDGLDYTRGFLDDSPRNHELPDLDYLQETVRA